MTNSLVRSINIHDQLRALPENPDPSADYCAAYGRESLDKNGQALAVGRQFEDLIPKILADGGVPILYEDNDTSATKRGVVRTDYQRMVADVATGSIHAVYAWDHTRLFRRPMEGEIFMELTEELGMAPVQFIAGGEKDLKDYAAQFEFRVNSAVAARHVGEMKAKQRRAFEQRADMGRAWWGTRPFGYNRPNRDGSGATINEAEAKLIRAAYDDVLHGRSLKGTAERWNAAGVLTARGVKWDANKIRSLLLNARNAGIREYTQRRDGQITMQKSKEADWPAIVEPGIYRGAVAKLNSRTRNPSAWVQKYLLSGLAICGNCKERMTSHKTGGRARYICQNCGKVVRSMENVDAYVTGLTVKYLSDQEAVERKFNSGVDTIKLQARQIELNEAEFELGEALKAGMKFSVVAAQLNEINREREDISAQIDVQPHLIKPIESLLRAPDIMAAFKAMQLDEQRAVVDTLFTVTIMPGQKQGRAAFDETLVIAWEKL